MWLFVCPPNALILPIQRSHAKTARLMFGNACPQWPSTISYTIHSDINYNQTFQYFLWGKAGTLFTTRFGTSGLMGTRDQIIPNMLTSTVCSSNFRRTFLDLPPTRGVHKRLNCQFSHPSMFPTCPPNHFRNDRHKWQWHYVKLQLELIRIYCMIWPAWRTIIYRSQDFT